LVLQSSAILGLNAWMQNPVSTEINDGAFNIPSLWSLMLNPMLPPKVLHQVISSWTLAGMLVVSISSYFIVKKRNLEIATNSFKVANIFTLVGLIGAGLAGHWSGSTLVDYQPMKFAAIEALWDTEHAENFVVFALPDQQDRKNNYALEIPGLLKLITADSSSDVKGFDKLTQETYEKIRTELKDKKANKDNQQNSERTGYSGLMAKAPGVKNSDIEAVAFGAIPNVKIVFWSFRVMMVMWVALLIIACVNVFNRQDILQKNKVWLWICVIALPAPWIATEAGWLVCEVGRQPWAVTGLLPTVSGGSKLDSGHTGFQLLTYALGYASLFLIVLKLSFRHMKKGWQI
jgi:cytochrome d ubiquinol oxidase subunit I